MTNLLLNHLSRTLAIRKLALFIAFTFFPLFSPAANLTLQGNFTADDNIQFFSVSIAAPAAVDIRSYGYAGGHHIDRYGRAPRRIRHHTDAI